MKKTYKEKILKWMIFVTVAGIIVLSVSCSSPQNFAGTYKGSASLKKMDMSVYESDSDAVVEIKQSGSTATITISNVDFLDKCVLTARIVTVAGTVTEADCIISADASPTGKPERLEVKNSHLATDTRGNKSTKELLKFYTNEELVTGENPNKYYILSFYEE